MEWVYKLQLIIHWLSWVLARELENLLLKDSKASEKCWAEQQALSRAPTTSGPVQLR